MISAETRAKRAASMRAKWAEPGYRQRTTGAVIAATPDAWTEREDARLMQMLAEGLPASLIARRMLRTFHAVRSRIKTLRKRGLR